MKESDLRTICKNGKRIIDAEMGKRDDYFLA